MKIITSIETILLTQGQLFMDHFHLCTNSPAHTDITKMSQISDTCISIVHPGEDRKFTGNNIVIKI